MTRGRKDSDVRTQKRQKEEESEGWLTVCMLNCSVIKCLRCLTFVKFEVSIGNNHVDIELLSCKNENDDKDNVN